MGDEQYVSAGILAARLGVPYSRVDRALLHNRIPYIRCGRLRLVRLSDIERVKESLKLKPAASSASA